RLAPLSRRRDAVNSQHGPRDKPLTSLLLLSHTYMHMIGCLPMTLIDIGSRRHRVPVLRPQLQSVPAHGGHVDQTRRATCATRCSLAVCCSGVSGFPASPEAKPHCGLTASRSRGMYRVASRIRASTAPASSSARCFVVSSPSTTVCCGKTLVSGHKC